MSKLAHSGQIMTYSVKNTWNFSVSLNSSANIFYFTTLIGEVGDMLTYSFTDSEDSGRLAFDATQSNYSDYAILKNNQLVGKINDSFNWRFSVLIETAQIQKTFYPTYTKYYALPGSYTIKAWLNDIGPFFFPVVVIEGVFNIQV